MGDMNAREAFNRAFYTDVAGTPGEDVGGAWAKDVLGAWGDADADGPLIGLRNDVRGAYQGTVTRGTANGAAIMLKGLLGGGVPNLNLRAEIEREAKVTKALKAKKKRERERLRSLRRRRQQTDEQRERERLRSKRRRLKMTADQKRAEAVNKTQRRANLKQKNETLAAAAVLANALGTDKSTSVA